MPLKTERYKLVTPKGEEWKTHQWMVCETVAELINELSKMPFDAKVYTYGTVAFNDPDNKCSMENAVFVDFINKDKVYVWGDNW